MNEDDDYYDDDMGVSVSWPGCCCLPGCSRGQLCLRASPFWLSFPLARLSWLWLVVQSGSVGVWGGNFGCRLVDSL